MGLLWHRRNIAIFRTHLSQSEYIQALLAYERTRVADTDPFPYPPPPSGAPILVTQVGAAPSQIRHYSGPMNRHSPIVDVHFEDEGDTTLVRAEFCPARDQWGTSVKYEPAWVANPALPVLAWSAHVMVTSVSRMIGRRIYRKALISLLDGCCG